MVTRLVELLKYQQKNGSLFISTISVDLFRILKAANLSINEARIL